MILISFSESLIPINLSWSSRTWRQQHYGTSHEWSRACSSWEPSDPITNHVLQSSCSISDALRVLTQIRHNGWTGNSNNHDRNALLPLIVVPSVLFRMSGFWPAFTCFLLNFCWVGLWLKITGSFGRKGGAGGRRLVLSYACLLQREVSFCFCFFNWLHVQAAAVPHDSSYNVWTEF